MSTDDQRAQADHKLDRLIPGRIAPVVPTAPSKTGLLAAAGVIALPFVYLWFFGSLTTDKIATVTAIAAIATLGVVAYYTVETYLTRKAAAVSLDASRHSNETATRMLVESFRPVVVITSEPGSEEPIFSNVGLGPAMRPFPIWWDGVKFRVPAESNLAALMTTDRLFRYEFKEVAELAELVTRFPEFEELLRSMARFSETWLSIIYWDLDSNPLYSSMHGRQSKFLASTFSHRRIR